MSDRTPDSHDVKLSRLRKVIERAGVGEWAKSMVIPLVTLCEEAHDHSHDAEGGSGSALVERRQALLFMDVIEVALLSLLSMYMTTRIIPTTVNVRSVPADPEPFTVLVDNPDIGLTAEEILTFLAGMDKWLDELEAEGILDGHE